MTDSGPNGCWQALISSGDWLAEPIITERCRLRKVLPLDMEFLVDLRTDPQVRTFLGGSVGEDEARRRAESEVGQPGTFLVELRSTGAPVGLIDIGDHNHGGPEVSYALAHDAWGCGLGFESVGAVVAWFFEQNLTVPLLAVTPRANLRSARLLQHLDAVEVRDLVEFGERQVVYLLSQAGCSAPASP